MPTRFDREAFFLGIGLGIVFVGVGALIIWATLTAPEGATQSTGFTTAQRLARALPRNVQNWLALGLAGCLCCSGGDVRVGGGDGGEVCVGKMRNKKRRPCDLTDSKLQGMMQEK